MASTTGEERSSELEESPLDRPSSPAKKMTPGQRLAARKEAKAKRKADQRGKGESAADEVAGEVEKAAAEFSDFWSENQTRILVGIAGFLAIAVGVLLWTKRADSDAAAEAAALYTGVESALAPVQPDAEPTGDADEPVFSSVEDRATSALDSFASLREQHPDSQAAMWGSLAKGSAELQKGELGAARQTFEAAADAVDGQPELLVRALEGQVIALEAQDEVEAAQAKLDALEELADGRYQDLAAYHRGRLLLKQGKRDEAKDVLKAAYDRLTAPEPGAPARSFLKNQVELTLTELDSSLVDKPSFGAGAGGMTQEQLQQLIQQMQQKQQQGAP